jgi:phospholipid/cholesterol/gamma-HCH transport system ATP-binding protein
MHTLPPSAQEAIRDDLEGTHKYSASEIPDDRTTSRHQRTEDDAPTGRIPVSGER